MAKSRTPESLIDKGTLVQTFWKAVDYCSIDEIPGLLRRVLETRAWEKREQDGRIFEHKRFSDFIVTTPPAGCGWNPEKVERLIKDDPDTLRMFADAMTDPVGNPDFLPLITDNISNCKKGVRGQGHGTSLSYTLRRLKKNRPDLYRRVIAEGLSANAAAKIAGWRKEPTSLQRLRSAWKKANKEEQAIFLAEIL